MQGVDTAYPLVYFLRLAFRTERFSMNSYIAKKEEVVREWFVVDAADKSTGRLAVYIADILRGRDKPTYTPHVDTGAFVVVVNAEKIKFTGKKEEKKIDGQENCFFLQHYNI